MWEEYNRMYVLGGRFRIKYKHAEMARVGKEPSLNQALGRK